LHGLSRLGDCDRVREVVLEPTRDILRLRTKRNGYPDRRDLARAAGQLLNGVEWQDRAVVHERVAGVVEAGDVERAPPELQTLAGVDTETAGCAVAEQRLVARRLVGVDGHHPLRRKGD